MPDKEIMIKIRALEETRGHGALDALQRHVEGDRILIAPDALIDALMFLAENCRATADLYQAAKLKGAKTAYIDPLRTTAQQLDIVIKQLQQPRRAPLGQLQPPRPVSAPPAVDIPDARPSLDALVADAVAEGRGQLRDRTAPATPAPHYFELNDEARQRGDVSCTAIVEHPGGLTGACGLLPGHPVHDGQAQRPPVAAAVTNGALADGGSASSAGVTADAPEGAALGVTDGQRADHDKAQADMMDNVTAYLSGEIDTLPGPDPAPSTVRDQTDPAAADDFTATAPTITTAKEILPTVTQPTYPPVPLLGQPGDMGAGYDRSYIPPGGEPATFAELMTLVPPAALPAHLSHSQAETLGDCPAKYRLQRLPRALSVRDGVTVEERFEQIPEWAQIGGSAFHAAVQMIEETMIAAPGADPLAGQSVDDLWRIYLDAEIRKVEATSPVPRTRWRAANKGAEHEAWWRANGPGMLANYLAARPDESTAQLPAVNVSPGNVSFDEAIELEREVFVPTPYGPLPYIAIIDRVTWRQPEGGPYTLVIRDYKTGARMPEDAAQLGEYANVLRLLGVPPQVKIVGTYFNARKGVWTPEIDLDEAYPADWFAYTVATAHARKLALTTGPTPARPSSFCGGCSVRWACPIKGVAAPGGAKR